LHPSQARPDWRAEGAARPAYLPTQPGRSTQRQHLRKSAESAAQIALFSYRSLGCGRAQRGRAGL